VFSMGPRGCIGKEIAMQMIETAVIAVLEKWEIKAAGRLDGNSWLEMQFDKCPLLLLDRIKL
jgi:cytochrome P450